MSRITSDTLYGTLNLLILRALRDGALHGLAIQRRLHEASDEALSIEEGALYPALHRMERRGWLTAEWAVSEKNRKAKYYELTKAGRDQLRAEDAEWRRYVAVVGKILAAAKS